MSTPSDSIWDLVAACFQEGITIPPLDAIQVGQRNDDKYDNPVLRNFIKDHLLRLLKEFATNTYYFHSRPALAKAIHKYIEQHSVKCYDEAGNIMQDLTLPITKYLGNVINRQAQQKKKSRTAVVVNTPSPSLAPHHPVVLQQQPSLVLVAPQQPQSVPEQQQGNVDDDARVGDNGILTNNADYDEFIASIDALNLEPLKFDEIQLMEDDDSMGTELLTFFCPICFHEPKSPVKLACDHVSCYDCIVKYQNEGVHCLFIASATCPVCRGDIFPMDEGNMDEGNMDEGNMDERGAL